jgi:hypothetical protein
VTEWGCNDISDCFTDVPVWLKCFYKRLSPTEAIFDGCKAELNGIELGTVGWEVSNQDSSFLTNLLNPMTLMDLCVITHKN